MREDEQPARPLHHIGPSLRDLGDMPLTIRREFGRALRAAQNGVHPEHCRPFGEGLPREVLKLVDNYDGDTYRAAFVIEFPECVYLLHVFKKKSASGIATPRPVLETIRARLNTARADYRARYAARGEK